MLTGGGGAAGAHPSGVVGAPDSTQKGEAKGYKLVSRTWGIFAHELRFAVSRSDFISGIFGGGRCRSGQAVRPSLGKPPPGSTSPGEVDHTAGESGLEPQLGDIN